MTRTAIHYAQALFELAVEEGVSQQINGQLDVLCESFKAEPAFLHLLCTPNVTKKERCQVIDGCFRDQLHPYVLNVLKLLTEKGDIRFFSDCCKLYKRLYNENNGIMPACAVTAIPLQPAQMQKLTAKLSRITGKKVVLTNRVDPGCLGGIQLNYNGKQIDDTVKNRLQTVAALLKNTAL